MGLFDGFKIDFEFKGSIRLRVPPRKPQVLGVITRKEGSMAARTSMIILDPVVPADQVTSRPCSVVWTGTVSGVIPPPLVIDMFDPNTTFATNDGDVLTVTPLGDVNSFAASAPGDPFPYTVALPPPPPPTAAPRVPQVVNVISS